MPPVDAMTFTDRAMEAVSRGLSIVPCRPNSKEPNAQNGAKSRVNTIEGVLAFAKQVPADSNYGICSDDTYTVFETDDVRGLVAKLGAPLPQTLTVSARPNRGYFVYEHTTYSRAVQGSPKCSNPVFEWRNCNQYCVGFGSIHPATGKEYALIRDVKPVPMPDWLVDKLLELSKHNSKPVEVTDEEKGSYDLEILGNVLQLWREQNPAFEFQEGRVQSGSGYWIRCPGEDGWPDGERHSEDYKGLSSAVAAWVTNGHPRWRCQHTHCGSKSWKDLVAILGPGAQRRVLTGSPLFGEARHTDRAATERFLASEMDLSGGQAPLPGASEREAVGQGNPEAAPGTAPGPAETEDLATPRIRAFTDLGNTERFLDRHKDSFRYTAGKGWYSFDGSRWVPESDSAVMQAAWETVRAIGDEPEAPLPEGHRGRPPLTSRGWMRQSESGARLAAMVALVKHAPGIAVKEEAFDQHDWLFNVQNGTVDLKTGTLHPHDRTQLLSTISPVKFDPRATCPEWLKFLDRVMLGRQEIVNFMQRLFGYCASASTAEQAFVVHYGTGANGKSTALDVIKRIFGSYAETTPFATFAEKKNGATPNDLASIHKSRLVIASEGERTTKLAESMIKTVTGNEEVSARYLYKDYFTFRPRFTLMLQSNHKPIIQDTGKGIWRRVRFVPWEYTFPDIEMDKNWAEKEVAAEGPGILAWVVRGALEYQRMGLSEPDVVKAAIAEYQEGEDVLGRWIREECTAIPDHDAPAGGLYSVYRNYMQATGETAIKDREFKAELIKRGFRWRHTKKGNFYTGLKSGIIEVA